MMGVFMNFRDANSLFLMLLLASCGKEKVVEKIVEIKTQSTQTVQAVEEVKKDVVKTEANLVYKKERKTALRFDSKGQILNRKQYVSDFNKRRITVTNEGRALEKGELRCYDSTDPNMVTSQKISFIEDGTLANYEINLSEVNREHKFTCSVYENNEFIKGSTAEFSFYEDIQLNSIEHFNKLGLLSKTWNKVGALVLNEGSTLLSDGETLLINAEEIVAFPGSEISTFGDEELKALPKKMGKHGGNIELKTEFATGELHVTMRGQNGGDIPADFRPNKIESFPSQYIPGILDGLPESGRWVNTCDDDGHRCFDNWEYNQYPTSGKDGYKGQKGIRGFPGMKGGHTGIFKLTAQKDHSFQLQVDFVPGKGSAGGTGGLGGPGSPGGAVSCDQACGAVKAGSAGPNGDVGDSGETGEDGSIQFAQYLNQEDHHKNIDFNMYR